MSETSVAAAFERSAPHVERLSIKRGPFDPPTVEKISDVTATLWERKGKRIRPHLVYWFGEMAGISPERLDLYAWAAEAIHTATLLHDDVIDEADKRRGGPSANQIYDNTLPILSGDYLISDVIQQIATKGHPEILLLLCETLKKLCSGEFLQYELKFKIPSSGERYYEVTELKTSSLFRWCGLVGPILARNNSRGAIETYMHSFGLLFQLSDDLLDVIGTKTKHRWNDLREGKLNLVTWRMVQADEQLRNETAKAFERKEIPDSLIRTFEKHPKLPWTIHQTHDELKTLAVQADLVMEAFPHSGTKQALQDLAHLLIDRCS
ncbi:MAG TPA: polyprenyl synthetase family protein [Bdellovibrionota bacterium]|nr:polyprenyl synthetase family protein [Bdellovibrionota bacterium]